MNTVKALLLIVSLGGEPSVRYTITQNYILKEFVAKEISSFSPEKALLLDINNREFFLINGKNQLFKQAFHGFGKWVTPDIEKYTLSIHPKEAKFGGDCYQMVIQKNGLDQITEQLGIMDEENEDSVDIREVCSLLMLFDFLPKDKKVFN